MMEEAEGQAKDLSPTTPSTCDLTVQSTRSPVQAPDLCTSEAPALRSRALTASISGLFSSSRPAAPDPSAIGHVISATTGSRILSCEVPSHILRAVRLEHALEGFGKHWEGTITGGLGADEAAKATYELSEEVNSINDFLSHDWATRRFLKFFTLVSIYNFKAALLWSALAAVLVSLAEGGILASGRPLPLLTSVAIGTRSYTVYLGISPCIIPPVVFALVLLFGQNFPRLTGCSGKPVMTFLDKMCIHQTDAKLKAEGIRCLAGFLKSSDRLVILWSPRYLTRLWCVYEVATWTYLKKDFRTGALFAPTSLYSGALGATVGTYLFFNVFLIVLDALVRHSPWLVVNFITLIPITICIVLPLPLRLLRRTMHDLHQMREQFQTFSIESSECYCCSVGHKMPGTGEELQCDRELVYQTLTMWFDEAPLGNGEANRTMASHPAGSDSKELASEPGESHLDRFNHFVHTRVMPDVCDSIFSVKSRYWLGFRVSTPVIWYLCSRWMILLQVGGADGLRFIVESFLFAFLLYPAILIMSLRLATYSNRLGGSRSLAGGVVDFMWTTLLLGSILAVCVLLYGPLAFTRTMEDPVYQDR